MCTIVLTSLSNLVTSSGLVINSPCSSRPDVLSVDLVTLDQLLDEVKVHVDVLGVVATFEIVCEFGRSFLVLQDHDAILLHALRHE